MKGLLLLTVMLLASGAHGEDLARLHARLAEPSPPPAADCAPAAAPPGTRFAPGARECAPAPSEPRLQRIGIERSRCLVGCPAYTFIVEADGTFSYLGRAGVARLGAHRGRVDRGRLRQLLRFAEAIDALAFDDSYRSGTLDNATVYVLLETPEVTKVIADEGGSGPPTLWALEQLIDDLLTEAVWEEPAAR